MDRELQVALAAATQAAGAVREIYGRADAWVEEKADGKGPLTAADLASNDILTSALRAAFPADAILSEESADDASRLAAKRVWIIDPLDGTRDFIERRPEFVVSVGLAIDGQAALGVLVNPATGEVFTGVVGEGATYNGAPCVVSPKPDLDGARVVVSGSEFRKGGFERFADRVVAQPIGSVAYKLGLVAAGLADATFTPKPRNEWDLLGGVACVLAAGGRATDGAGVPYTFNRPDPLHRGVVVTNGALHDEILEMLR